MTLNLFMQLYFNNVIFIQWCIKEVKLEQEKKIFIFYEKYIACFQDFQSLVHNKVIISKAASE